MKVNLFFVRHQFSCANNIEKHGSALAQLKRLIFTDPPLTQVGLTNGRAQAREPSVRRIKPDLVLSSTLVRAVETALTVFPGKRVSVAPFVKEVGWGGENAPSTVSYQHAIIKADVKVPVDRVDYRFVTVPDSDQLDRSSGDLSKFLLWLQNHLPTLMYLNRVATGKRSINVAVVSHGTYMRNFLSSAGREQGPFNGATVKLALSYGRDGVLRGPVPKLKSFRSKRSSRVIFTGFAPPADPSSGLCAYQP